MKNHIFVKKSQDEQGNEIEEDVEIEPENYYWALDQADMEPADEFLDPEGNKVVIPVSSFENALKKGYKPTRPDPSAWEAFKIGWQKTAPLALGMEGFTVGGTPFAVDTVEEELAWQRNPVPYSLGRVGAGLGIGLAGGAAAYGGGKVAKKGYQKLIEPTVESYVKPVGEATWQGMKKPYEGPDIAGVVGAPVKIATGLKAGAEQFKQSREMAREIARLKEAPRTYRESKPSLDPQRPPQSDSAEMIDVVTPPSDVMPPLRSDNRPRPQPQPDFTGLSRGEAQTEPDLLGRSLLLPGESNVGRWVAEKAATMAPGQLKVDPLKEILSMGTTRRSTARNFLPERAGEEIAPDLIRMEQQLKKAKSEQFGKLQSEAQQQWATSQGAKIPSISDAFVAEAATLKIKGPMANAIAAANRAIREGVAPASRKLTREPWEKVTPQEQFARIQYARELVDEPLRAAATGKLSLTDRNAIEVGQNFRNVLDESLKSVPAKVQADELYKTLKESEKLFFKPMKFGEGKEAKIDVPKIKRLFGDNPEAYRMREGIETMRATLDKYGDAIPNAGEMRQIVDRYDQLRKIAEDRRLLESVRQAQGPSSPELQRTRAILGREAIDVGIFSSPAGTINQMDEFIRANARRRLGVDFESASPDDQNKLVRLLKWTQDNPNATQQQVDKQWQQMYKGRK